MGSFLGEDAVDDDEKAFESHFFLGHSVPFRVVAVEETLYVDEASLETILVSVLEESVLSSFLGTLMVMTEVKVRCIVMLVLRSSDGREGDGRNR